MTKELFFVFILLSFTNFSWGNVMDTRVEKAKKTFNQLKSDNVDILDRFYANDALFVDPIGQYKGLSLIKAYFAKAYSGADLVDFEFTDEIVSQNKLTLVWTMSLKTKNLKNGELIKLDGTSVLKYDLEGLVSYHRDYYDMGELIYENIPVLSWVLKKIKAQLK